MGSANDLVKAMTEIAGTSPRCLRQMEIEHEIVKLAPDAMEAMEILDALIAGLKKKVDEFTLGDVLHQAAKLREALDEVSAKDAIESIGSPESWEVE